jgi:hypothetical protein
MPAISFGLGRAMGAEVAEGAIAPILPRAEPAIRHAPQPLRYLQTTVMDTKAAILLS